MKILKEQITSLKIDSVAMLVMFYFFSAFLTIINFILDTEQHYIEIRIIIFLVSFVMFFALTTSKTRSLKIHMQIIYFAKGILIVYLYIIIRGLIELFIKNMPILTYGDGLKLYDKISFYYLMYILFLVVCYLMVRSFIYICEHFIEIYPFNKNSYSSKVFLFVVCPILLKFILLAMSHLSTMLHWNLENSWIFITLIITCYFTLNYYSRQKNNKDKKISINCVNLDNNEIKKNDVYLLSTKNKNYQIFKFDFNALFPEDSTEHVIYITNKYYSHHANKFKEPKNEKNKENDNIVGNNTNEENKNNDDVNNSECIYLSIDKYTKNEKLTIYYSYKQNGKQYKIRCDLYLEIRCLESAIYISQYQFKNFRRVFRKFERNSVSILDTFTNTKRVYAMDDYPIEYHVLNSIKYYRSFNDKIKFDEFVSSEFDTRKWLFHDDKMGSGKTTIDLYFAMQQGYQPVIISPWEDNYDKDILQLIYLKLSKNNRGDFFANISAAVSTRAFIFWPIAAAAIIVFFDNEIIKGVFDIIYYRVLKCLFPCFAIAREIIPLGLHEIRDIFFVVSAIIISYIGLWSFILFKKDSTRDYQDFYIKRIQSIFKQNPNIFLIIEDVDRLDPDIYNNVFRILSLLNKEFHRNNAIGLISLDRKIIEKNNNTENDKENDKENDNEQTKEKRLFKTLENKIIYQKIAEDYNYRESMNKYLEEGVEFLYQYNHDLNYDCDLSLEDLKNEIQRKSDDNFRDAHKEMESLIKNINSGKYKKN
jgi:hypothetical protein